MTWKDKIDRLSGRVAEKMDRLAEVWDDYAKKYPMEQIPMQTRDTKENREWQAATLDLQNHLFYMKRNNIDPDLEIPNVVEMDGKTVLNFLGEHHGLPEGWWVSGSGYGFSLEESISDTPIQGKEGMHDCYSWGFDYINEAVRVRDNISDVLNEGKEGKIYGEEKLLNEEQIRERFGNVRLYLNIKFYPFKQ